MPRTIRFHLDEHVPHAVADGLRLLGIDVTTTTDANLLGALDDDQIAYGLAQSRVIFTEDDDFLVLAAAGVAARWSLLLSAKHSFHRPDHPRWN